MRTIATLAVSAAVTAVVVGLSTVPASAACTRLGFSVNDYGKEGPARDAKRLLDTYIAKWTADRGIKAYRTGPKSVNCELYLNLIVFDEHTCRAEATVCWDGPAVPGATPAKADGGAAPAPKVPAPKAPAAASPADKAPAPKAPVATPPPAKSSIYIAPAAPPPERETDAAPGARVEGTRVEGTRVEETRVETGSVTPTAPPAAGAGHAEDAALQAAQRAAAAAERAAAAAERAAAAAAAAEKAAR